MAFVLFIHFNSFMWVWCKFLDPENQTRWYVLVMILVVLRIHLSLDGLKGTSTGKPPIFYRKKHRFLYTPMRKATTDFVRRVSCSVAQDSRMIKLNKHLESFRDEFHQLVYSWAHHIQAFIGDLLHKRNRRTAEEPKFALNTRLLHAWTNFGMFTTFCTFWFIRAISLHTLLKC